MSTNLDGEVLSAALAAAGSYTLTVPRLWTVASGLLVLVSVVAAVIALARSTGQRAGDPGRRAGVAAVVTGLAGVLVGVLVLAAADGGPGSGSGVVGGYVSVVAGLAGTVVGGWALARARRAAGAQRRELV